MATTDDGTNAVKTPMSAAHKEALAKGRSEGRVVKAYLDALVSNRPRRGRRRTRESIAKRLEKITTEIETVNPLTQLVLIQERMDLEAELETMGQTVDIGGLENDFVTVAAAYAGRKNISYAAWREIGVDATVLRRAGIKRTRN